MSTFSTHQGGVRRQVGDKIIAIDGEMLNFRKFVEAVGPQQALRLRVAGDRTCATGDSGRAY